MKTLLNYRYYVLAILLGAAIFFICCDSDSELSFWLSKVVGIIVASAFVSLFKFWSSKDQIPALTDLDDNI
jgi:hypothetical protein